MIGEGKGRGVLLHVDRLNSIYPPQNHQERHVAREVGRRTVYMHKNVVECLKWREEIERKLRCRRLSKGERKDSISRTIPREGRAAHRQIYENEFFNH